MSHLENDVKLILSPMVLGSPLTLTGSQQARITAWLAKTAMMYDSMDKGEVFLRSGRSASLPGIHNPIFG
jgi:hypothetical protein